MGRTPRLNTKGGRDHWGNIGPLLLAGGGLPDYLQPSVRELGHYLGFMKDEGLSPTSIARHLIALKMFYRFLRLEERGDTAAVMGLGSRPSCCCSALS